MPVRASWRSRSTALLSVESFRMIAVHCLPSNGRTDETNTTQETVASGANGACLCVLTSRHDDEKQVLAGAPYDDRD